MPVGFAENTAVTASVSRVRLSFHVRPRCHPPDLSLFDLPTLPHRFDRRPAEWRFERPKVI